MNINPSIKESISFSIVLDSFYVYTGDKTDRYVQRSCIESGIWDKELTEWMIANIKPGWVCLDIGANIFYFTELMSRLTGKEGKVLAFEPIKRLCKVYKTAQSLNNYENCSDIEVFPFALSDKEEDLILNIWEENIGGSGIVSEHRIGNHGQYGNFYTEPIKSNRLDSVYNERIDFIKIDVEGHELAVLQGAEKTIASSQPNFLIEVEERHREGAIESIKQFFYVRDYKGFFMCDNKLLPLERFNIVEHQNPKNVEIYKKVPGAIYINDLIFIPTDKIAKIFSKYLS